MRRIILTIVIILITSIGCSQQKGEEKAQVNVEEIISNKTEPMTVEDTYIKFSEIFNIQDSYESIDTEERPGSLLETYLMVLYNENTGNTIEIVTDKYGNLVSYKRVQSQEKQADNYDWDMAKDMSEELMDKLYKNNDFKFLANKVSDQENYIFTYLRQVNNILVPSDQVEIHIDKRDLEINAVNVKTSSNYDFDDTSYFEDLDGVKDRDLALVIYKEKNPLYFGFVNYNDNSNEIKDYKPVYKFISPQIPINAKTLEEDYLSINKENNSNKKMDDTQEDKKTVNNIENQDMNEVNKKARELFDLDNSYQLDYFNYISLDNNDYDLWELNYIDKDNTSLNILLNSEDLSLVSYLNNSDNESSEINNVEYSRLEDLAIQFITNKTNISNDQLEVLDNFKYFQNDPYNYSLRFVRKAGDSYIFDNYIDIIVNNNSEEVLYFYKSWDSNLDTDKLDEMSYDQNLVDELYTNLLKEYDFQFVYIRDKYDNSDHPLKPYYLLINSELDFQEFYMDPKGNILRDLDN